jgi:hypothetical protein
LKDEMYQEAKEWGDGKKKSKTAENKRVTRHHQMAISRMRTK